MYSWPSVRNDRSLASSWAAMASASRPLTRYASAPAAASGREQTQHQQHPGERSERRCHVGQDVGVLEAHVGQRVLEAVEARAAPQAERLLQAVRDQKRADGPAQQQQTEVLGAAPVVGPGRRLTRARSRRAPLHRVRREWLPPGWTYGSGSGSLIRPNGWLVDDLSES